MGNFFLGSVGPRDHLEPKIGLLFQMSRLMVIFTLDKNFPKSVDRSTLKDVCKTLMKMCSPFHSI